MGPLDIAIRPPSPAALTSFRAIETRRRRYHPCPTAFHSGATPPGPTSFNECGLQPRGDGLHPRSSYPKIATVGCGSVAHASSSSDSAMDAGVMAEVARTAAACVAHGRNRTERRLRSWAQCLVDQPQDGLPLRLGQAGPCGVQPIDEASQARVDGRPGCVDRGGFRFRRACLRATGRTSIRGTACPVST